MTAMRFNYTTVVPPLTLSGDPAKSSRIQIARTGNFTSTRYGRFSITTQDLAEMAANFGTVMPVPPTQLVIDFDHLSNNPQRPEDGKAAGWIVAVELRNSGTELWALANWTPRAADAIANQEYRFISPSFVKDYTDTHSGKQVGTTLLACALTNRPFLQSMAGVSLCADAIVGDLGFSDAVRPNQETSMAKTLHLAAIGDRVSFTTDTLKVPELTDKERADVYVVQAVTDAGDLQFVRLATVDSGKEFGWFEMSQLGPAPALDKKTAPPANLEPVTPTTAEEAAALAAVTGKRQKVVPAMPPKEAEKKIAMSDTEANHQLIALASTRAREKGIRFSDAVKQISNEQFDLVAIRDGHRPSSPVTSAPISLHATQPTSFYDRVMTLKAERKIGDLEAITLAQQLYPEAAQRYADTME